MQIDRDRLRAQYQSMSDEELLAIDPSELTDLARSCYEAELSERELAEPEDTYAEVVAEPADFPEHDSHLDPDWLETAEQACSFVLQSATNYAEEGETACAVLRRAGIPYQVVFEEPEPDRPVGMMKVMVPGHLVLKALSVLDKEIFNREFEETWRSHLPDLSDQELKDLHPDAVCAGLLDRAQRYRRIYAEEVERRRAQNLGAAER